MSDELDIEVGRHALRTFIRSAQFGPMGLESDFLWSISAFGHWDAGGSAIAKCMTVRGHEAPSEDCRCGLYGTLTLDQLAREYLAYAQYRVVVFAAEGTTYIGTKGLRTAAARIVAYWGWDESERKFLRRAIPSAEEFADIFDMLSKYGFPKPHFEQWPFEQWPYFPRPSLPGKDYFSQYVPPRVTPVPYPKQNYALTSDPSKALDVAKKKLGAHSTAGGVDAVKELMEGKINLSSSTGTTGTT